MKIIDKGRLTSKASKSHGSMAAHYFGRQYPLGSARNPVKPGEPLGTFDERIHKLESQFISGERRIGDKISQDMMATHVPPKPRYTDRGDR